LAVFAVIVVVTFLSAANDNARIGRMKADGIPVTVTVLDCAGNIGGSGSNAAGYTCRGEYSVGGATYHELIGSMTTFAAPGTTVSAIADPSRPSSVVLASAVKKSDASPSAYVAPGLLAVVLIALTLIYFRVARRSTPRRRAPAPASSLEP
jgi:predicted transcriptional regulator